MGLGAGSDPGSKEKQGFPVPEGPSRLQFPSSGFVISVHRQALSIVSDFIVDLRLRQSGERGPSQMVF